MITIYQVIVSCLISGKPIEWSCLCSWCDTPAELKLAVAKCAFYGVSIENKPNINDLAEILPKGGVS